jgi:hypothetical protein
MVFDSWLAHKKAGIIKPAFSSTNQNLLIVSNNDDLRSNQGKTYRWRTLSLLWRSVGAFGANTLLPSVDLL